MTNLASVLSESAAKHPENIAVKFMGQDTTYAQLEASANKVAHALQEKGIGKGDRVAIYCINSPFFVASYFGIQKTGATVVTINLLIHPNEVKYIMRDSGAKVLIAYEVFAGNIAQIINDLPDLEHTIIIGETDKVEHISWADIMQKQPADPVEVDVDPAEDVAAILYTSGTTGNPKGAMLTHKNILSNSQSVVISIGIVKTDRLLVVLPMFHSFSMTCCLVTPIRVGAELIALPRFDPNLVADSTAAHQATLFFGVPSMYISLMQLPEEKIANFKSIRYGISGGAAMPKQTMIDFEKKFPFLIYEGYGPTECSPVTTVNPIGGKRKIGSIGLPITGVEMKIFDDNGKDLPNNTIGEIVVRGDNVMKGYFNLPKATQEAFFGDWYRTGDMGECDDDGYYYILDRKKDLIIVNGMNVYPRMIEEVLAKNPAVRECAVIGVPHKRSGEMVKAYVVLKEADAATPQDLRRYCLDNLAQFQTPRRVEIIEKLPRTATGKILKRELRKWGEHERGFKTKED